MASKLIDLSSATDNETNAGSAGIARDQIRGSSLFLIGNVLSLAITFIPHLVLVRYLSTEAYGHWAYALSLVAIGKTYALGFNEAMSRFVPIYHTRRESSKVLGSIVVVFAMTLLISGFLIATFAVASHPILALLTKGREPTGLLLILMLSSKGAAAVTGGGFITLAATLQAIGTVPMAGLTLLLGVDRFMSEMRALTNLVGNGVAAVVVAKWERELDEGRMMRVLNGEEQIGDDQLLGSAAALETVPSIDQPV